MLESAPDQLQQIATAAQNTNLLFIVGKPGSGKSQALRSLSAERMWEYVDCRNLLTDDFLELIPAVRPQCAPEYMLKILEGYQSPVILLDRLQVLFTPMLRLEPLSLLASLSEHVKIIVAWPGEYIDGNLMYQSLWSSQSISYAVDPSQIYCIG